MSKPTIDFNCDESGFSCCKSAGKHNPDNMSYYEAVDGRGTRTVKLCPDQVENSSPYGWLQLMITNMGD